MPTGGQIERMQKSIICDTCGPESCGRPKAPGNAFAALLGDDVLALARDMISDGEGDRSVWESLQSAGAALHAVKRTLVAENRR